MSQLKNIMSIDWNGSGKIVTIYTCYDLIIEFLRNPQDNLLKLMNKFSKFTVYKINIFINLLNFYTLSITNKNKKEKMKFYTLSKTNKYTKEKEIMPTSNGIKYLEIRKINEKFIH